MGQECRVNIIYACNTIIWCPQNSSCNVINTSIHARFFFFFFFWKGSVGGVGNNGLLEEKSMIIFFIFWDK